MDVRKELGGKVEDALMKLVDEKLSAEVLTPLITALINTQIEGIKEKVKEVVDLIDGEKDLP